MPNDASRAAILDGLFQEAEIPIDGISVSDVNAVPPVVNVAYKSSATAEQVALGNQILAGFDWRRRRALARATVATGVNALTAQQRLFIDAHVRAEFLRVNPSLAAKIGLSLAVPIPVDEVDPT